MARKVFGSKKDEGINPFEDEAKAPPPADPGPADGLKVVPLDPLEGTAPPPPADVEQAKKTVGPEPSKHNVPVPELAPVVAVQADAKPERWRVLADKNVLSHGALVVMRAGKVVDSHNFDVALLRDQGVMLQKLEE